MDFGQFEGQPWSDIPKAEIDLWIASFGSHRFGGQESANEVLQRVTQALQDSQAQQFENVLWITHAGVIRAATLLARGVMQLEAVEQWPREVPVFGGFTQLVF